MSTQKLLLLTTLVIACFLSGVFNQKVMAKYEEPQYKVLAKEGCIELRQYQSRISASVEVSGSDSVAANQAFRLLAGYIFGKNKGQKKLAMTVPVTEKIVPEKIAMTVPVTTEATGNSMSMSFFMPSQYTLDSLPVPDDERIKFNTLPPERFAVIRFSGLANERAIKKRTAQLQTFLNSRQLQSLGKPIKAFYNAPWTLPFLRRNEIWIPIAQ